MSELVNPETGEIVVYDPDAVRKNIAKADALADYARKVKDWPLLEQAVDAKIEEQREFVEWWDEKVSPNRGGDRGNQHSGGKSAERRTWQVSEIEKRTGISHQQVSRWRKALKDERAYRERVFTAAYKKAMAATAGGGESRVNILSGDTEWYTPKEYIDAARSVLGGIDLDPASNAFANEIVKAKQFYSEEDNGLEQVWSGRIWLNPPYKFPLVEQFVDRLVDEIANEEVHSAVLLTNNATDTGWWHTAAASSALMCFTRGRISFYQRDGEKTSPTHGQTFFYFGSDVDAFYFHFKDFGLIR